MAHDLGRLARQRPAEVALRDDRSTLGWAAVDERLNRVANALIAAPLGADPRGAVCAENSGETLIAHLGALLAGVSSVPVNFHLTTDEVAYILEDSGSTILFVGPETAAT